MRKGFFSLTVVSSAPPVGRVPKCGTCGLFQTETCHSPKMQVQGQGKKGILIIGDSPNRLEDQEGALFIDGAGRHLASALFKLDIDMRRDCWLSTAIICHPGRTHASAKEIGYCRPNITKLIDELKPKAVILLGEAAIRSVIIPLWGPNLGKTGVLNRWAGWQIPCRKPNMWICPTYHPASVMPIQGKKRMMQIRQVGNTIFNRHLANAVAKTKRPWVDPPNWSDRIEIIQDPKTAVRAIRSIMDAGRPIAFDYEASTLKPDGPEWEILCCSVSNGKRTIVFPWAGKVIAAMKRLLLSKLRKYGTNIKFEQRLTMEQFGVEVRNWDYCTMIGTHHLDYRKGITGLKFQAFVTLGQPPYDNIVAPYIEGKGGNGKNRLKEVPIRDLLLYCGIDSLNTWILATIQKRKLRCTDRETKAMKKIRTRV